MARKQQQQQMVIELEEQLEELKSLVASQQAQLPAAPVTPVIDAEISPIASESASEPPAAEEETLWSSDFFP